MGERITTLWRRSLSYLKGTIFLAFLYSFWNWSATIWKGLIITFRLLLIFWKNLVACRMLKKYNRESFGFSLIWNIIERLMMNLTVADPRKWWMRGRCSCMRAINWWEGQFLKISANRWLYNKMGLWSLFCEWMIILFILIC